MPYRTPPARRARRSEADISGPADNAGIEPGIWTYPSDRVAQLIHSIAVLIIMAQGRSGYDRGTVS